MLWKIFDFKDCITISDPHAHLNTFVELVKQVRKKFPLTPIFVIGDMIDKGKRAKELVEFIKTQENMYALLGNHDHLMTVESRPFWKRYESLWLMNNGDMTHRSYGGKWKLQNRQENKMKFHEHLKWFRELPLVVELPNIEVNSRKLILSHARIDKTVERLGSLEKVKEVLVKEDARELIKSHWKDTTEPTALAIFEILWNKLDNPDEVKDLGIYNVFGHTTQEEVLIRDFFACIDTHVYKPNKMSAVHFPSKEIFSQETLDDSWGEKG